jgi:predicted MFS family arabinose efflux permease
MAGLLIDHSGFRAAFLFMALLPLATWFWVRRTVELPPVIPLEGAKRGRSAPVKALHQHGESPCQGKPRPCSRR